MKDITKAIQGASLTIWDQKIPHNPYWKKHCLLDSTGAKEKYRHTLYVHVVKNEEHYNIYDNNPIPNEIVHPHSYMIKLGMTRRYDKYPWKGIIGRRQDDFKSHYHHRTGIHHAHRIPLTPASLRTRIHPRFPHLRIGSSHTLLHGLINLNDKPDTYIHHNEGILRKLMRTESNYNGVYAGATNVTRDRINIPIASVPNEDNFIEHVREVFEGFEGTL